MMFHDSWTFQKALKVPLWLTPDRPCPETPARTQGWLRHLQNETAGPSFGTQ